MKYINKQVGFTAVELLITLFIAAVFLLSGLQLYASIIKTSGETRFQTNANNVIYDYMQRYKSATTNPCTSQTPLTNAPITVAGLSDVTITVVISCPYSLTTSVSKILATILYDDPQQTVSNATYINLPSTVTDGLVLNLDAGITTSYPGTGTVWNDLSTYGNNGALNNGVGYSASNNGSLSLDGVDDYVNVGNGTSLNIGNNLSIGAWIRPTSLSGRFGVYSTRNTNQAGSFQLEIGTGSSGVNRVGITGVGTWRAETPDNAISLNTWKYIVYATDGTNQNIYINSVSQSITAAPYTFINNSDFKLIGQGTVNSQFFSGSIGAVQIYNRALSITEVQQNFNALRGRYGV